MVYHMLRCTSYLHNVFGSVYTYEEVTFHFNLCIQVYFILLLDYLNQNIYELPKYYLCELIWLNIYIVAK